MDSNEQSEFDFGAPRQARIGQALSAVPAIRRAVPLSDADKLMLACMNNLAQQIADEITGLSRSEADNRTSQRVTCIIGALDEVSEPFALETARFLTETVHRLRAKSLCRA